ncbi:LysR family transcriptional regulator [Brachybacterium sp. YJGR34]|uniref:LysR family transcriptional regulator n=1 Tax=Brachybacterium sp. YJGR34 TaxID=2059911 RepID=UPI000E0A988C|nr:LysR family transcriptional regulator [Brachybacterium sp. YJGR34]
MSIPQLEALVAVADEGSFTEAAGALGVAQPSLSRRIRGLEQVLGAALFVPVGRRMELSDAGRGALVAARRILREREELIASMAAERALAGGTLRIVGLPSLLATRAPQHIGAFHRAHPGVRIDVLAVDDSAQLIDALRAGRADLGFGIDDGVPGDLLVAPVAVQTFVAVLPEEPADERQILTREELRERSLVTLPRGTSIRAVAEAAYSAYDLRPPRTVTTSVRDALVPLALACDGATIVPDDLALAARGAGARVASLPMGMQRSIGVLHRRDGAGPPAVETFLTLLRQGRSSPLDV